MIKYIFSIFHIAFISVASPVDFVEKRTCKLPEQPWSLPQLSDLSTSPDHGLIEYGLEILNHTSQIIGPNAPKESMRFTQNNLNCAHCHIAGPSGLPGTKPYSVPWINVINEYPKFDERMNKAITLEDMILKMIGHGKVPIKKDSKEVKAIVAYMTWLGGKSKTGTCMNGTGLKEIHSTHIPDARGGRSIFNQKCTSCHDVNGQGRESPDFKKGGGYLFPPLAGNDTYDDCGHMAQVPLLASFIYTNMPLGSTDTSPQLSVENALDLAAYVNGKLTRHHCK